MILAELLRDANVLQLDGSPALDIRSLGYDSRQVREGCLFFAIAGQISDGHAFLDQALSSGAVAVASERPKPARFPATWVRVPSIRRALASAARAFYGYPDHRLRIAGITG
ncbi:MAG: Mur ligase domain-containing protein, partial [Terriglobia bacterium]